MDLHAKKRDFKEHVFKYSKHIDPEGEYNVNDYDVVASGNHTMVGIAAEVEYSGEIKSRCLVGIAAEVEYSGEIKSLCMVSIAAEVEYREEIKSRCLVST